MYIQLRYNTKSQRYMYYDDIMYRAWHIKRTVVIIFYILQNMRRALIRIHKFSFSSKEKSNIYVYIYSVRFFIAQVLNVFLVENKIEPVKLVLCMFQPLSVDDLLLVHSNWLFSLLRMHYYTNVRNIFTIMLAIITIPNIH